MTGLYIHYPFCKNICFYCHFIKTKYGYDKNRRYIKAILKEIEKISKYEETYDTIYFGGGTPSLLRENIYIIMEQTEKLLKNDLKEVSIEINPEDINTELIKILKSSKISRVSIGIQQVDNRLLKLLGRKHSIKDIFKGIELFKKEKFILNFDFIVGIPTETTRALDKIMDFIKKYEPDSVSIYILENLKGKYWEKFKKLDDDNKIKNFELIESFLESIGIQRYEISNFAKEGKESIHNLKYWNYENFIGIGPSASSLYKGRRWKNMESLVSWENNTVKNRNNRIEEYFLSSSDIIKEAIMMGLRKTDGINIKYFKKRFGVSPVEVLKDILKQKKEFFDIDDDFIKIKRENLFIFNSLLSELF